MKEEIKPLNFFNMKPGTYYSFYIKDTNKGDNIRYYAPVFEVEVKKVRKKTYEDKTWYFADEVEISKRDKKKITKALLKKLEENYLVNAHAMSADYFSTREDAEKYHDYILKEWYWDNLSKNNKERYKDHFYTKLKSKIETDSLKFYDGLTKKQKSYVAWLSENETF